MIEQEEKMWLNLLAQGNENAFRLLYERFFYPLSSFACKYLNHMEQARDYTQDILFELYLSPRNFNSYAALKYYLYNGMRFKCLNTLKRNAVEQRYLNQIPQDEPEFFLHRMIEEEVFELLEQAVRELPATTRSIYEYVLLGWDNKKIASEMDLTEDAVKSHRKRGKKILQEKLKHLFVIYPALKILISLI